MKVGGSGEKKIGENVGVPSKKFGEKVGNEKLGKEVLGVSAVTALSTYCGL